MQEEKASEQTLQEVKTRAVSASQLVSSVTHAQCSVSAGQELYQLSKEKADFSVAAGEEDESTAGSSGENDGNSRSSTPHSSIKSPPSKSPAKAQKAEGKMVLSGEEPQGCVLWVLAFCQRLDDPTFHMDLRDNGQSCSDPWLGPV